MFGYSTEHGVTQKPPTALPIRMAVIKRILIGLEDGEKKV